MSKMVAMRQAIQAQLKSVHPRVYYEMAPDDAKYPFLVYNFSNSVDDGTMENFVLDVDGWDSPQDANTLPLEQMMAEADAVFKQLVIQETGMAFVFYRENRLPLTDADKRLRGRRLVYQVRTFGGD